MTLAEDKLEAIANEHFRGKCYLHQDWLDLMHSLRAVREQVIRECAEICKLLYKNERYAALRADAFKEAAERILAQLENSILCDRCGKPSGASGERLPNTRYYCSNCGFD